MRPSPGHCPNGCLLPHSKRMSGPNRYDGLQELLRVQPVWSASMVDSLLDSNTRLARG